MVEKDGMLDQYAALIKQSWIADYELWGAYSIGGSGGGGGDYEAEAEETDTKDDRDPEEIFDEYVETLRSQLIARRNYIDENIDEIDNLVVIVKFMDGDQRVCKKYVRNNSNIPEMPEAEEKEGLYFRGWFDERGTKIDNNTVFTGDTVCTAVYVDEDEVSKAQVIYFRQNEVWISSATYDYETPYTLLPADAEDKRIKWDSSDENVATVDEKGRVLIAGVGKTEITATLSTGKKFSYGMNVYEGAFSDQLISVEKLMSDPESMVLEVGEYGHIDITYSPTNADFWLEFESENPEIAEVDENGVVLGVKNGETFIIAKETVAGKSIKIPVRVGKVEDNKENGTEEPESPETGDAGIRVFVILAFMSVFLAAILVTRGRIRCHIKNI